MDPSAPYLGIDFGTSRSSMAWVRPETGMAELILNAEGEEKTPSVVYFGPHGVLVGSPAEAMLEEEGARRIFVSSKRNMVTGDSKVIDGVRIKPVEAAAEVLRKLKRDAEGGHFHAPVSQAVIAHPAAFGQLEQDKIREAATLAGFTTVELIPEPVAAALAYERAGLKVGDRVLVYDLGGGTFDVAVLARGDDGVFRQAMPTAGEDKLGGDDFDRAIYEHCDDIAHRTLGRGLAADGVLDLTILRACRAAKERLTDHEQVTVTAYLPAADGSVVSFRHALDRTTFEGLIAEHVEQTVKLTRQVVETSATQGSPIDTVVLIGGAARVPLIQRRLRETLPVEPRRWQKQDVAVALGTAVSVAIDDAVRVGQSSRLSTPRVARSQEASQGALISAPRSADSARMGSPDGNQASFLRRALDEITRPGSSASAASPPGAGIAITRPTELQQNDVSTWAGHESSVACVSFDEEGRFLITGAEDGSVKVWEESMGRYLHTLQGGAMRPTSLRPLGKDVLIACAREGKAFYWSPARGSEVRKVFLSEPAQRSAGSGILVASTTRDAITWCHSDRRTVTVGRYTTETDPNRYDRQYLGESASGPAGLDPDDSINCVEIHGYSWEASLITGNSKGGIFTHQVVRDSNRLALRRGCSIPREFPFIAHAGGVTALGTWGNGRILASGGANGSISVWFNGSDYITSLHGEYDIVRNVEAGDLSELSSPKRGSWIDLITRVLIPGHGSPILQLALDSTGRLLASLDVGGNVSLWSAAVGSELAQYALGSTNVTAIAFSRDGTRIALGHDDGRLGLWRIDDALLSAKTHENRWQTLLRDAGYKGPEVKRRGLRRFLG